MLFLPTDVMHLPTKTTGNVVDWIPAFAGMTVLAAVCGRYCPPTWVLSVIAAQAAIQYPVCEVQTSGCMDLPSQAGKSSGASLAAVCILDSRLRGNDGIGSYLRSILHADLGAVRHCRAGGNPVPSYPVL